MNHCTILSGVCHQKSATSHPLRICFEKLELDIHLSVMTALVNIEEMRCKKTLRKELEASKLSPKN